MSPPTLIVIVRILCILSFLVVLSLDLRRRRLSASQIFFTFSPDRVDLVPPAFTAAMVTGLAAALVATSATGRNYAFLPVSSALVICLVAFLFFWQEGRRQIQFQRPTGLIFGEWLIIFGILFAISTRFTFQPGSPVRAHITFTRLFCLTAVLLGIAVVLYVVPPFLKKYEGLRILERVGSHSDDQFLQPESTPPTPECPNPELWKMRDTQSTEVEVLDFLTQLVITTKPKLVVETGTFLGYGTLALAAGLKANGFGKLITIEFDPEIHARALERIQASGLAPYIESRLESSLETVIPGTIDLLFSDSHLANREAEIRRLLPQLDPRGVLVIHDASSHFKIVREAALRLEAEGLISAVLLSTPRGVVVAQRREGRA
jgi:predicted O-methyltransferase YrrM